MKELFECLVDVYEAKQYYDDDKSPVSRYILYCSSDLMEERLKKLGIDYKPYYSMLGDKTPREVLTLLLKERIAPR